MKLITSLKLIAISAAVAATLAACESTGGSGNASSGTNYGTGMKEPQPPDPVIMIEPTTGAGPRGGGR